MLSEETIKQIFFYCDHHEPNAIVADDVDIIQFANRISEVTEVEAARKEHARCVALVKELNRVVGEKLETLRPV
jgi:hypothetical protein